MIKEANGDVPELSGLLVIDWWQECDNNAVWSQGVKEQLKKLDFATVVIANYEITPSLDDPAQFNTIQQYGWYDYHPKILSPMLKECGRRQSNGFIQNNYGHKSFALYDVESFSQHLEYTHSSHVKNWLVVGGHWLVCTHHRPLGFKNLLTLSYNFFITEWSIYKSESPIERRDIEKDSICWLQHDDLYQLSTQEK